MEELDKKIAKNKEYLELIKERKKCVDPRESRALLLFDVLRDLWIE